MRPSASFCRQQEDLQRLRAASEPLENRRAIALAAAKAWGAEALLAESRGTRLRDAGDEAIAQAWAAETDAPDTGDPSADETAGEGA